MPTEALDLDTNVYADWCIERLSNKNMTTKGCPALLPERRGVLRVRRCQETQDHVGAEDVGGGEVFQRRCCRRFPSVVGGEMPWKDAGMAELNHSFTLTRATSSLKNTYGMRKRRMKSLAALEE